MKKQKLKTENLGRSETRMMLDFMGIPLQDHKNIGSCNGKLKLTELKKHLGVLEIASYDEWQKAYDSVVLHKTSTGKVENVIPVIDASRLIKDEIEILKSSALSTVELSCEGKIEKREKEMADIQRDFVAEVDSKFKAAVERESKKFNTQAIKINSCKPKKVNGIVHEKFPRMIQLASARKNILLVGPSGCGKTHVAEQLAEQLDLRYGSQSCSAGVSESAFAGWLIPIGKSGQFVYVTSVFVDMYENGGVFLFDEMDNSDANVLVFLNQALANGKFFLPQRTDNTMVKRHKDFVAIGCANTFGGGADGMYHGRIALDAATLDRFRVGTIFMDYSPAVEEKLVNEKVLAWGRTIRAKISSHKLRKLMSTRMMIDASDMIEKCDWSIADIEEGYFADWSREEKALCGFTDGVQVDYNNDGGI